MTDRRIEAAKRYAEANKSDPFALKRAMTHIRNGVASFYTSNGQEAFYNAEEATETRVIDDGRGGILEYQALIHRNIVRP